MHSILTEVDSDLFRPFEGKCFNLSNCHSIVLFEGVSFKLGENLHCTDCWFSLPFENSNSNLNDQTLIYSGVLKVNASNCQFNRLV